jgi:hypothetical protein
MMIPFIEPFDHGVLNIKRPPWKFGGAFEGFGFERRAGVVLWHLEVFPSMPFYLIVSASKQHFT